ncbi:MAG: glycosyltransferase family 4 protein [Phycisphaerales bacterium]|nr:MAG: glycosyltransferase family 4 protein [Phycisphaerales bacterium]
MLTAYAHPSCKAILYRSECTARNARMWLHKIGIGELADIYLSKIQVLYPVQESCSPDAVEEKWSRNGPLTIVFCGRDYEVKNGRMALEIFSRLSREFTTNRFVYIGEVPQEELSGRCKQPTSVVYHPSLSHEQTLSVMRDAHVLFHPSKFEGLGIVFLEAAASGMAVVTATGGAMRDVEELFGTGGAMLVNRDSVGPSEEASAFEANLRHILSNPSVAKSMARHNFNLATLGKLSPERNRRILQKVYENAMDRPAETPLTLDQIPYRNGPPLRLDSCQLEQDGRNCRRELNITETRFLL